MASISFVTVDVKHPAKQGTLRHAHTHILIHTHSHMHTYTHIHTHIHTYTHTWLHIKKNCIHIILGMSIEIIKIIYFLIYYHIIKKIIAK